LNLKKIAFKKNYPISKLIYFTSPALEMIARSKINPATLGFLV